MDYLTGLLVLSVLLGILLAVGIGMLAYEAVNTLDKDEERARKIRRGE
jgi:hypothetical protein